MMSENRARALFISDCHLGGHNCKGERLYRFLCTHEADTIYLVGDIVEMNVMAKWPPYHLDCIRELARKASAGSKIIYIPGNHDIIFRSHAGCYGRLEIKTEALHVRKDGREMLVLHGDVVDTFKSNRLLQVMTWLDRAGGIDLWEIARSHLKWCLGRHADAFEHAMINLAKKRGYSGILCGHVHSPKVAFSLDHKNGVDYLNCGDWTHHCTAISEDQQGHFEVLNG